MSNGYALAAVTAVLRNRLNHHLTAAGLSGTVGDVTVSALPPDRIPVGSGEPTQLNVFLHQATPSQAWRNTGLPAADSTGAAIDAQPLALDLHYLLTAYGSDMYVGEIVLGHALRALHDEPLLTRPLIREALNPATPDPTLPPVLRDAGLADQVETIRLTPTVMTAEEMSKVWSALQAHYRPTASYTAHAVLIDSERPRRPGLPVSAGGVSSRGRAQMPPVLDAVENAAGSAPITADSTVVLRGRDFATDGVLLLGEAEHPLTVAKEVTSGTITVRLADVTPRPRAGTVAAQVRMNIALGDPETAHAAYPSNSVAFVLAPAIAAIAQVTSTGTVGGVPVGTGHVDVTLSPPVTARQRVSLLLNEVAPPAGRRARSIALAAPPDNGVPPGAGETAAIAFPFTRVPRGDYVARLSVDGAESPLAKDGSGRYALPRVTL
ncbi:DUF4255 domain-containing protein [Streptomyces triculaminicus]|uniref:DUF4255 domain-containing protein n=1 Tax=Streptomyces triculaminicus TaxID=2816232 RepID=UPI0037D0E1F9